jgi:hypothetical protein
MGSIAWLWSRNATWTTEGWQTGLFDGVIAERSRVTGLIQPSLPRLWIDAALTFGPLSAAQRRTHTFEAVRLSSSNRHDNLLGNYRCPSCLPVPRSLQR